MPVFEDWLKEPLSIINNIFASDPDNFDQKVQEYFDNKLKSEKNYNAIPSLNEVPIHELTPNCLVRYRCMIQDSFDPVYYTGVHKLKCKSTNETILATFKYKENLECPEGYEACSDIVKENIMSIYDTASIKLSELSTNSDRIHSCKSSTHDNLCQRMTFYCVPIPGETEWVKNVYKSSSVQSSVNSGSSSNTSHRPSKRGIDENCEEPMSDSSPLSELTNCADARVGNGQENEFSIVRAETTTNVCNTCLKYKVMSSNKCSKTVNVCKKTKTEEVEETRICFKNDYNLNFPLASSESGTACLVKTYEDFDSYKINDMVEFVGVLSQDPSLAYEFDEHADSSYLQSQEDQTTETVKTTVEKTEEVTMDTADGGDQQLATNDSTLCRCSDINISTTKTSKHSRSIVLSSYPPSLVPRLHCIKAYNLPHNNPLLQKIQFKDKGTHTPTEGSNGSKDMPTSDESGSKNQYWDSQFRLFLANLYTESTATSNDTKLSPLVDSVLFENTHSYLMKLRQELVHTFQEIMFGDSLAAEYLLMNLISSVFMRKDVTILGKFALNLTNVPQTFINPAPVVAKNNEPVIARTTKHFAASFFKAIRQFVSMSHLFQLTIDNLNKTNLIPNKDYSKDKLITGMLQLPDNFNLIIDETVLNTGELTQKGLMNFNSIKDIIRWQKLNYDFNYHQQEFPTNMRVLILSQTKSILPFDCQLKLNPNTERFDADSYEAYMDELFSKKEAKLMNSFRNYLSIVSNLDYKIGQSMQKTVEDDIVNIRKSFMASNGSNNNEEPQLANGTNNSRKDKVMSVDDIHLLLIVARLQSLSYGKVELGLNEWNKAKSLEFERLHSRI